MLVGTDYRGHLERIVAARLDSERLVDQYQAGMNWLRAEPDEVTDSKFSLEMAWFRECWWEMVRRDLVTVN